MTWIMNDMVYNRLHARTCLPCRILDRHLGFRLPPAYRNPTVGLRGTLVGYTRVHTIASDIVAIKITWPPRFLSLALSAYLVTNIGPHDETGTKSEVKRRQSNRISASNTGKDSAKSIIVIQVVNASIQGCYLCTFASFSGSSS
jgi:hypothetical protein